MSRLMIIDDEESVCILVRKIFEGEGHTVIAETNPVRAIEIVKKESPECVLLDIKMPGMEGVEVLSRIKEFNQNIDVIIITGYSSIENAMESMKLGAFDYITKPFDINFLKILVRRCLESRNNRSA